MACSNGDAKIFFRGRSEGHIKQMEPIPPVQLVLKLRPSSQPVALIVVILFAGIRKSNGLTADRSVTAALIVLILFAGIRKSNGLTADRSV
ncbi:hypothetical protein CDAR_83101 [Caerostris darwini]|uniref:Uncharacterized protein n=1 Tax=Caerostris darwini TaxID=1538125 RepID=A0AAV4NS84_9ARAC|nr:hypothetical protein CDAR_83101 [Caerostris darwini]